MLRDVIIIDEAKCDGCGECVTACAEGALAIVNGKARLVSETYCDGLGACLGHCPVGAITVVKRDVAAFDQHAVDVHLAQQRKPSIHLHDHPHVCPGAQMRLLGTHAGGASTVPATAAPKSQLSHWPIQLALLNPAAPFLRGAELLLTAHCVPVAMPDFHQRWVGGHGIMLACPKLDDLSKHTMKLAAILTQGQPASLTVLKMEVPCCGGLVMSAQQAIAYAGWQGRFEIITVPIAG
ncbi:MAG: 4Fe-4S binding protein [Planctomycetota bacterium]